MIDLSQLHLTNARGHNQECRSDVNRSQSRGFESKKVRDENDRRDVVHVNHAR